ncbi:azurin [Marinicella sp. W31]|uniref:azurin n=1 Tax=Marinicella sp. W31 TaxID=3023713 RepID=UPI00375673A6
MKKMLTVVLSIMAFGIINSASAADCELVINSTDQMQFDKKELSVSADCSEVKLTLNHTGKLAANVMGHNWVLSKTADFQTIAQAGMSAGMDNNYVPQNDPRVLASSKVIGGGESTTITFSISALDKGGDYTFFCSFPGHWAIMKGTFKIT